MRTVVYRRRCSSLAVRILLLLSWFRTTTSWQQQLPRNIPIVGARRLTLSSSSSGDDQQQGDPVLRLPLMEAELATLPADKDPSELQTAIGDAKTAAEFGVRKAQSEFYDAFSNGDVDAMGRVWSTESHVRCVHPGMGSIEGREPVMESWKQILSGGTGNFNIEPARVQVEIHGLVAICSCVEKTEGGGGLEALNIYKREGSAWRMTLHMAGPVVMRPDGGAFF